MHIGAIYIVIVVRALTCNRWFTHASHRYDKSTNAVHYLWSYRQYRVRTGGGPAFSVALQRSRMFYGHSGPPFTSKGIVATVMMSRSSIFIAYHSRSEVIRYVSSNVDIKFEACSVYATRRGVWGMTVRQILLSRLGGSLSAD